MPSAAAPGRLARWATAALWPVALAVPIVPVLVAAPLHAASNGSLLGQLAAMEAVVLLATLAGARLVGIRLRRSGSVLVSRHESWAVLALALGGLVAAAGVAGTGTGFAGPVIVTLVDGLWTVLVAAGALVVLPLRALRTIERDER